MTLKEYLTENKIKLTDFASKVGIQQPYVSLIKNGHNRPSPDVALRIEQATGGAVTVMELLFPSPQPPRPTLSTNKACNTVPHGD
jgi:transcriptional regulator with XRE-family HTH domain